MIPSEILNKIIHINNDHLLWKDIINDKSIVVRQKKAKVINV
jgi:hypothetical protein